jgi:hypothetical protein
VSYTIPDEPRETSLGHLVVRPSMPLLASMLAGDWLALPWFAFNAHAMGSPTKRKEIALCAVTAIGTTVLASILLYLVRHEILVHPTLIRLALLAIVTWKLTLAYVICTVQSRTFGVYEYYGGTIRSGMYVLGAGFVLRPYVMGLSDDPLWWIIVSMWPGSEALS